MADKLAPMTSDDPRRQALIASLRLRYAEAAHHQEALAKPALAKQALFKEAVYLGIQPQLLEIPGEIRIDAR